MKLVSFFWGVAEATVFFLVPDVAFGVVAVRDRRAPLQLCCWAVLGALLGGVIMYLWARSDADQALGFVEVLPAISPEMVDRVAAEVDQSVLFLFKGVFVGAPYKVYAAQSGAQSKNLVLFLLVSIPARLARFWVVAWIAGLVSRRVLKHWTLRRRLILYGLIWVGFYAWFFSVMPS